MAILRAFLAPSCFLEKSLRITQTGHRKSRHWETLGQTNLVQVKLGYNLIDTFVRWRSCTPGLVLFDSTEAVLGLSLLISSFL